MSTEAIFEFVMLPVLGWLLFNSNRNSARLARMEFALKILMKKFGGFEEDLE